MDYYISKSDQKLMKDSYGKFISKKTQTVYNSKRYYEAIGRLKFYGYLRPICNTCKKPLASDSIKYKCDNKNKEHRHNPSPTERFYRLNVSGELFVINLPKPNGHS